MGEWDPIGVKGVDSADDEYDSYVSPIIEIIMQGHSVDVVADYLDWASNEHMECPVPREENQRIAGMLVNLKPRDNASE